MNEVKSEDFSTIDLKKECEEKIAGYIRYQKHKINLIVLELERRRRWKKDAEEILKEFKKL